MEEWETSIGKGVAIGIVLIVAILLVDIGLVWMAARQSVPSIGTFLVGLAVLSSLGLLALIAYWVYGLVDSGYFLDRNALIIHWGPLEQIIPIGHIERVFTGEDIQGRISCSGGVWPGHFVGYGEIPDVSPSLFYATARPRDQIYVATPGLTYGISPSDPEAFLESLRKRLEMGPTQVVEQSSKRPGFLGWTIWRDNAGLAMVGAGFLSLLLQTGLISFVFPTLPALVPLHFGVTGQPDRFAYRGYIFMIPLIGLSVLIVNGALGWLVNARERLASHLAWGGAVLVQVLTWVAAVGVLTSF